MTFYDLEFKDSQGNIVSMEQFRGHVVLIVNTATGCGLAPQFRELEELHQKYRDRQLTVIGFPCAQFANQEKETNETMAQTCQINFGVTFLLSEKSAVNGKETHPVFQYLKSHARSGVFGHKIKWNFTKFLVSADGKIIRRYAPTTQPASMEEDILMLLEQG